MRKSTAADFSREEIRSIATRYSNRKYSFVNFFSDYECSKEVFNELLETAILHCIVSQEVASSIFEVSVARLFNEYSSSAFNESEEWLKVKEKAFLKYVDLVQGSNFFRLSKQEAIDLTVTFSISPLPKKVFCKKYPYSVELLNRAINDSIIYSWIDASTIETLRKKAYKYENAAVVNKTFRNLLSLRSKISKSECDNSH